MKIKSYLLRGILTFVACLCMSPLTAQTVNVQGHVTDTGNEPVIGAVVTVKGQTPQAGGGTVTDIDGKYSMQNVPSDAVLVFSSIGMEAQEIAVRGRSYINVVLKESEKQLDEIVVVGYGTQKKVNLTGAVASVNAEKLSTRPATNVMNTLQGAVPGVTIIARPGGSSLNIRGRGNLGASEPLYIVDGIEVTSGFFNAMDPNAIETISFLKDASSAAIYGAKAAYGVVLVTTKSGKDGQLKVSYNGLIGSKRPTYLPKTVNSAQYAEMYRTAELNSGVKPENLTFTDDMIQKYRDGSNPDLYPDTDWFDLVLKNHSLLTKHNLQLSGGSNKFNYILGLGYMKNETLTPGEGTDRYQVSTKTSLDLKSWLKISSNINYIYDKYKRKNGSVSTVELLRVPPTQTARQSNGEWGSIRNGKTATGEQINANQLRALRENGRGNSTTRRLVASIAAELRLMDGLTLTNQFGYNYSDFRGFSFQNRKKGVPDFLSKEKSIIGGTESNTNQMDLDWNYAEKFIYDGWANYNHTFNKVHEVTAMVGAHADSYTYKRLTVGRKDFASNDMNDFTGGSTNPNNQLITNRQNADFYLEETMNSYFGRLGYTYDQKYLLEANFRADASSRFAKHGRWGYFPSFSAGWRMEQEDFMKKLTWLNGLKLRASWGKNGNIKNIGLYDTYSTFSASGNIILGGEVVPVLSEGRIGNTDLTWETTTTFDTGFDLNIKNGLFGLTVDYYNRLTDGILIQANDIMTETGLASGQIPARNVGKVRNRGFELSMTHDNHIGDFAYSVGFNMAYNKNKIINLGDRVDQLPPSGYWIFRKGGSVGDFYMLEANGLYSEQDIRDGKFVPYGEFKPQAGMVKYVDQPTEDGKGDGVINDKDRVVVGNDVPKFTYGASLDLSYKNFTLSVQGQGVTGVKVYVDCEGSQAFFDNSVPRRWQLDNWTPENPNAIYPKLFVPANTNYKYNNYASSFWLFNAAYFRIKNITLGYDIPKELLKKIYLTSARVYMSGDNLFTIRADKRMKDFDPEIASSRGYQIGLKSLTFGVSLTF